MQLFLPSPREGEGIPANRALPLLIRRDRLHPELLARG
ncbi:MAG: hypothetical protein K0S81_1477, partial [Rhodospirillales bacterium]|nr:hypothetical protein [Rhodospirillales bacterium]